MVVGSLAVSSSRLTPRVLPSISSRWRYRAFLPATGVSPSSSIGTDGKADGLRLAVLKDGKRTMSSMPEPIRNPEIKYTQLFINNEFVNATNGKKSDIIDPSTEERLVQVEAADHADVEKAVAAARAAFHRKSEWRTMDAWQRGVIINKLANLVEKNIPYLASLEAKNVGKPFAAAVGEMIGSVQILKYYAGWADKLDGKTMPSTGPFFTYTRHEPVGVCGQIIPWNVPLYMTMEKLGPVLATGCCMVLKPSEITPLTTLFICSLMKEAGVPPGVVNIVPGRGTQAGEAISQHPAIRKVSFTGSVNAGKIVAEKSGASLKLMTMELGGKSPLVVCDDVDVDEAVDIAITACFYNNGQACLNGTRMYVHEKIYDQFVEKAVARASSRVLGDVFDPKTEQGPQISQQQMDKILEMIQIGKAEGGTIECGGKRWGSKGYYVEPTVFSNLTDDMTVAKEEIFGPVMSILKWNDFEDVIDRSNDSVYGLASGILTNDLDKAMSYCQSVESGNVFVNTYPYMAPNCPFGGVKDSGFGRELGEHCVKSYQESKSVAIRLPYKHS